MADCSSCPSKGSCAKPQDSCAVTNNPNNKIKYVIGVMSGKGGVGKSSISVLLAKQLQKAGYKIGIMDADITGPSIPRLMSLEHEKAYGSNDAIEPVLDKDGIKVMSLNFLIEDENKPVVWRGPVIANAVKQFWNDVVWGELDFLFIDMPPGTGDVALTLMQSIPITGVVMVSTPQPMVSMIVSKAVNMCKEMSIEVFGVIENMSYILCPDCDKHIHLHDQDDTKNFLEANELDLLCELPMIQSIANLHKDDDYSEKVQNDIDQLMKPAIEKILNKLSK